MNCTNEPKATSIWKRCLGLETRSDKPKKSATREKEVQRLTHTSRTKGTSQTSINLSQKGPGTSVTHSCGQSHYNPRGGLQCRGTYKTTFAHSSQTRVRQYQILSIPSQLWSQHRTCLGLERQNKRAYMGRISSPVYEEAKQLCSRTEI